MHLSEQEFETYFVDGVAEVGLTLTSHQIQQFFFICVNYKSGIVASTSSATLMI